MNVYAELVHLFDHGGDEGYFGFGPDEFADSVDYEDYFFGGTVGGEAGFFFFWRGGNEARGVGGLC